MSASRWTKSFPLKNGQNIDELMTVEMDGWIVLVTLFNEVFQMHRFNIENKYWEPIQLKNPEVLKVESRITEKEYTYCLCNNMDNLFMWRRISNTTNRLLKYDKNTTEWMIMKEYIMDGFPNIQPKIIGNIMYMVETDDNCNRLIIIDIQSFDIKGTFVLESGEQNDCPASTIYLMIVNDVLYIIKDSLCLRTVSKFNGSEIEKLGEMSQNYDSPSLPIYVSNCEIHMVNNQEADKISIDIFDVVSKKWSTKDIEKSGYGYEIEAVYEDRGDMYTVFAKPSETVIRMYERIPNLSTLTMLKVTDELLKYNKMGKIEELKKSIPVCLRKQLSAIAGWREQEEKYKKMDERRRQQSLEFVERRAMLLSPDQRNSLMALLLHLNR